MFDCHVDRVFVSATAKQEVLGSHPASEKALFRIQELKSSQECRYDCPTFFFITKLVSYLNLKCSWLNTGHGDEPVELSDIEVGDSDGLHQPHSLGFHHALPCLHVVHVVKCVVVLQNTSLGIIIEGYGHRSTASVATVTGSLIFASNGFL